jgi:hypothetical protein
MYRPVARPVDGCAPSLMVQAHDAITGHAQATREPTAQELASNETGPRNILGQPQASRFSNAFVSEINFLANPVYTQSPLLGLPEVRLSPDPGRFLITGRLEDFTESPG